MLAKAQEALAGGLIVKKGKKVSRQKATREAPQTEISRSSRKDNPSPLLRELAWKRAGEHAAGLVKRRYSQNVRSCFLAHPRQSVCLRSERRV